MIETERQTEFHEVAAQTARRNLVLLIRLRWFAVAGQIAAISVSHYGLGITLPRAEMAPVIGFLILLNLSSGWRIRTFRPISDLTVLIELLGDVTCLTILLYLSGGASNPFVSLYILQVILGIILLPPRFALVILVASIIAHFWLLEHGMPLDMHHFSHGAGVQDLHLFGMFLSFALSACLLAWFVTRIMSNMRARDEQIAAFRRQILEDDHLVRLGLLASGAAHELGTPLTTIAVTLDDWHEMGVPAGEEGSAQLIRMLNEIARCRGIVSDMLISSGQERLDEAEAVPAAHFAQDLVRQWMAHGARPTVACEARATSQIIADPMLEQALRQLFDNAAEAGAANIALAFDDLPGNRLAIHVRDDGPGFPPEMLSTSGQPYLNRRPGAGRGLGLFLTFNAIRRMGGEMKLANSHGGGAEVTLLIPALNKELTG